MKIAFKVLNCNRITQTSISIEDCTKIYNFFSKIPKASNNLTLGVPQTRDPLWPLAQKLNHYFWAKFCGKSHGESPVSQKQLVLTQLKWHYWEKGFLSAVPIQTPDINFFYNLITWWPNLHGNVSIKF